jgi:tRNA pseudouridine synthase 10
LAESKKILKEYDMCDYCLGRLFAKKLGLVSNKKLGQKIHKSLRIKNTKCYVCKNIFEDLPTYVEKMRGVSSGYDFQTFLIGAKLKPSILDRDDHIRSHFKLRGIDGIKTNITRELAKQFARKTKKKGRQLDPDITLTIDFKVESCEIQSKPLFLSGRYTKLGRNMPQKQKPCSNCLGKGCVSCNHHGISEYNSVEGVMSKYYFDCFGAIQTKITWVGGEDDTSLVLGSGRPFFAKILQPKKRNIRLPKKVILDGITLLSLKQIKKIPALLPRFVSKTKLLIKTDQPLEQESLSKLLQLKKNTVAVYDKSGKRAEKLIHDIKYKINSENSFYLSLIIDGGVPLKRFVSGDDVFPNISDLLQNKSKCETFDFEQIQVAN